MSFQAPSPASRTWCSSLSACAAFSRRVAETAFS